MNFYINDDISLTAISLNDEHAITKWLGDGVVQQMTCHIPFPYGITEARDFIERSDARCQKFGRLMDWAIRSTKDGLIGVVSLKGTVTFSKGTDEIGFWLAQPYWGKGIMTDVLKGFVKLSFDIFFLQCLQAIVLESNDASRSVVLKCGFVQSEKVAIVALNDHCPKNAVKFIRIKNQ